MINQQIGLFFRVEHYQIWSRPFQKACKTKFPRHFSRSAFMKIVLMNCLLIYRIYDCKISIRLSVWSHHFTNTVTNCKFKYYSNGFLFRISPVYNLLASSLPVNYLNVTSIVIFSRFKSSPFHDSFPSALDSSLSVTWSPCLK